MLYSQCVNRMFTAPLVLLITCSLIKLFHDDVLAWSSPLLSPYMSFFRGIPASLGWHNGLTLKGSYCRPARKSGKAFEHCDVSHISLHQMHDMHRTRLLKDAWSLWTQIYTRPHWEIQNNQAFRKRTKSDSFNNECFYVFWSKQHTKNLFKIIWIVLYSLKSIP